ncbi:MAG TPA: hypothetical protein VN849_07380, partial [Stellaceae bacterium]|nr:hypothetical protein [Stellaceae bacterium]
MLSNLSPRASNAAASSGDNVKSTGVDGRAVVAVFDAVIAASAAGGDASEGSPVGAAGGDAREGSPAGAAGGDASEGSPAGAAGA